MAVKSEAFLALEASLSKRLLLSWQRSSKKVVLRIGNLLERGEFDKARRVVDEELSMEGVVQRNLPYVEFVMLQSAIYGAARITPIKKVSAFKDGKPPQVKRAAQVLKIAIEALGTEAIKAKVHRTITRREIEWKERHVQKDEGLIDPLRTLDGNPVTTPYTREFASAVDGQGKAIHDYSSSLHTSRMAQYGFLVEASITGVTAYRINEQLDNRTCNVCEAMNGRTFPTQFAHAKVEMWLAVENPEDMKSIAPFPSQNAVSVDQIRNASREDLIESGWDTPPFHPLCRGQLDPILGDIPVDTAPGSLVPEAEATYSQAVIDAARAAVARAQLEDKLVTPLITDIADEIGGEIPAAMVKGADGKWVLVERGSLEYRMKGQGSTQRKLDSYMDYYKLDAVAAQKKLGDSLRYTLVFDDDVYTERVQATLQHFKDKGYTNIKVKNTWDTPSYKGINTNMTSPNGLTIEVQLHTPSSFHVKQEVNHAIYEDWRRLNTSVEKSKLQAKMIENSRAVKKPADYPTLMRVGRDLFGPGG